MDGNTKNQNIFFLTLLFLVLALNFFIFLGYLTPIVLAVTLAVMANPVHERILKWTKNRKNLSALLTTIFVLIVIMIPLSFFGWRLFLEAKALYGSLSTGTSSINDWVNSLGSLKTFANKFNVDLSSYLINGANSLISHFGSFFSSFLKVILDFSLILFGTFFVLRDGKALKTALMKMSPLSSVVENKIFDRLELAIDSVIRGQLTIAVIQGIVASAGFALFGLPNPLLWGSLCIFAALVPSFGTSLVLVPAVIYMYLTAPLLNTIGLGLWSIFAAGLIDNILAPFLIHRYVKLHPFLIFLSVLGGVGVFGPVGFLLGPLALVLLITLLDIRTNTYGQNREA